MILTVGRIGTFQKNSELLLEVLKQVKWGNDWVVNIVGPIEEDFATQIQKFYADTHLEDRVFFVGAITDRERLFEYYNRAKVFCMTSRWESFGIVFAEAQSFGNYIVSTPLSVLDDFIQGGTLGREVGSVQEMAEAFNEIISGKYYNQTMYEKIKSFSARYQWASICGTLDAELKRIEKKDKL